MVISHADDASQSQAYQMVTSHDHKAMSQVMATSHGHKSSGLS